MEPVMCRAAPLVNLEGFAVVVAANVADAIR
jgi:hypothetical protein